MLDLYRNSAVFSTLLMLASIPAQDIEDTATPVASAAVEKSESVTAQETDRQPVPDAAPATGPVKRCYRELSEATKMRKIGFVQIMPKFGAKSPRGTFPSGESPYVIVDLPEFKKAYRVEISLIFDLNILKQSTVMIPSAMVLDQDFCVIEDIAELDFESTYGAFVGVPVEKAFLPIENGVARYVLVYSDARQADKEVQLSIEYGYGLQNKQMIRRTMDGYFGIRINR